MLKFFWALLVLFPAEIQAAATVEVKDSRLVIDGVVQPQLFGAEVQYFRLRGGYGRNIPRERVIELWNKALDKVVEAKMNSIGFYIPWDFHEYAEGKFDFDGTADEDGDGHADYPSRDLRTWFRLVKEHGIKVLHVRPGPFINAEWGFLGFGAIPPWFHEKYPDSHMKTPWGWNRPMYDYLNPDFLRHSQLWFQALYEQVLKEQMGPGQPIAFLQLDNETNYQWNSLYSADYSRESEDRYRRFLEKNYGSLEDLNRAHGRNWAEWAQIETPKQARQKRAEDRDWYRFNDYVIFEYLGQVRKLWENLGVREPAVMFTLAESYNAPGDGVLPHYVYKNMRGTTGLMMVNLYPKTYETSEKPLLNSPFKADLDVKSATAAGNFYFGTANQEWAMGPEVQGGWWRGIPVTPESRQQTYLTVLGHGMKAMYVYYFNEGQNWDIEWGYQRVRPIFESLRKDWRVEDVPVLRLPNAFWGELQARVDRTIVMGLEARRLMEVGGPTNTEDLFFDAPLDAHANPRPQYERLKFLGERLLAPNLDFLARALEAVDAVAFVKDSDSHAPVDNPHLDSARVESDWSGALLGYMLNAGVNPQIVHGDLAKPEAFRDSRVLVHLDTGLNAPGTLGLLREEFAKGKTVVNFLAPDAGESLGIPVPRSLHKFGLNFGAPAKVAFHLNARGRLSAEPGEGGVTVELPVSGPVFTFDLSGAPQCRPILYWREEVVGYRCAAGEGRGEFTQIGAMFFEGYNGTNYARLSDVHERRLFLESLFGELGVERNLVVSQNSERTVAFGRKDPRREKIWVTVKTGTEFPQKFTVRVGDTFLRDALQGDAQTYRVRDLLHSNPNQAQVISRARLVTEGFSVELGANGSGVYVVEKVSGEQKIW